MDEQECQEFYDENGLGCFYGYDSKDGRWNLVINMEGKYYLDENGWWTLESPVELWYPI